MLALPSRELILPKPRPFRQRLRDLLNPIWVNGSGDPIVDGGGAPIDCPTCPCDPMCSDCEETSSPCSTSLCGCTPDAFTVTLSGTGGDSCCGGNGRSFKFNAFDMDGTYLLSRYTSIGLCMWRYQNTGESNFTGDFDYYNSASDCTGSPLDSGRQPQNIFLYKRSATELILYAVTPYDCLVLYKVFTTASAICTVNESASNDLKNASGTSKSCEYDATGLQIIGGGDTYRYFGPNNGSITIETCDQTA